MYNISTLKNGLTLITVNLPHLDSVTTLVAVKAGSRFEKRSNNGISHFLEHMSFKGSKKYPSSLEIASLIDGVGAVNNAATSKEYTYYWIKSAAEHLELSSSILSSQLKEPLLKKEEINREKGVIIEELRMYRDNPAAHVWDLYELLQFGDQPLGWDVGGNEKNVISFSHQDFVNYMNSLYSPSNMVLVYVGKLPPNISQLAEKYFLDLPLRSMQGFAPFKKVPQNKPKINVHYKDTDQVNLVLGVEGYSRHDPRKYPARVLGIILGEGMSSRMFTQIREKRGLAYRVGAGHESYTDTGSFVAFGGLKLEKAEEGLQVIKDELLGVAAKKVSDKELKKAKEMERGRMALRMESTNFLGEYFGIKYVLDREIETFEDYLKKIDAVTVEDVWQVAKDLFKKDKFNLQIIGPLKDSAPFEKILK
ncbi:MAG: insulinase family protein [Patescibacteria group bacterium]|nr:insulinase family protein [Patescibacteria group bacterium]